MARFDKAFKQPYEVIATRFSQDRGDCSIIYNKNSEIYYIGIGINVDNIKYGGDYGVRESATKEDAYNELYALTD